MTTAAPRIDGLTFVRTLGRGGYADVYLYHQAEPDRDVAVKVIRDVSLSDLVRRRFRAEANAMAKVQNHRNIASVFTVGATSDMRPYLVMQYYPGGSVADGKRRSVQEVLQIGINIGSAIETAHRKHLFHRDIKPHNILFDDEWHSFVLADFGIAGQQSTDDGDVGVSIPWSAPEVLYDKAPAGVRSDVYSLAATLWTLLAGRSPFEISGADNGDTALMSRIRTLPPPSVGRTDVPSSLDRLLVQAMAKDPSQRPESAMDFIRWLQRVEQELRFAPTRLEVSETTGGTVAEDGRPTHESDAQAAPVGIQTRVKTPGVLTPGPAGLMSPPTWGSGFAPTPVTHVPGRAPAVAATIQRGAERIVDEPSSEQTPPRSHRPFVIAAVGVLSVVAVVVVVVLNLSGSPATSASTSSDGSSTPQLDNPMPPGPVTVSGKRADTTTVVFTWSYPAVKDGDSFQYKIGKNGKAHRIQKPGYTATDAPGRTCIYVNVVRADGSFGSQGWPNQGCSG